jgi:hypothetical protein
LFVSHQANYLWGRSSINLSPFCPPIYLICISAFVWRKDFHQNCFFVFWQSSLDALEKKNLALELELVKAQKDSNGSMEKLREVEHKCSELQQNVKR